MEQDEARHEEQEPRERTLEGKDGIYSKRDTYIHFLQVFFLEVLALHIVPLDLSSITNQVFEFLPIFNYRLLPWAITKNTNTS